MAIDMIEDNELSALAPSRLGMRQFANDNVHFRKSGGHRNFTAGDDYMNLFGKNKARKNSVAERKQAIKDKFANLPTDCGSVEGSIEIVQNEIEGLIGRIVNLKGAEKDWAQGELDQSQVELTRLKQAQTQQGCLEAKAAIEQSQAKAETLQTLTDISNKAVDSAKADLGIGTSATSGSTSKLLLYGGIGAVVLIVGYLIIKK